MIETTYAQATKNAAALKQIGMTDLYLSRQSGDHPWHLVTGCEPGGSIRLEISTSVRFKAFDPATRLTFSWLFDIETMSANGKGHHEIDAEGCRRVIGKLPAGRARDSFLKYLRDCAKKVRTKGDEWRTIYERQIADAATLERLARED